MKRAIKTRMTNLLRHHLGQRALAAVLVPLACAAATLVPLNRPPTAENLLIVAAANVRTPIVLKGSDPDGDPLTYKVVSGSGPGHGTLDGTAPNLSYLPDEDFLGQDSFTYEVNDGHRTGTSKPATVSISVKKGLWIGEPSGFNDRINVAEGNSGLTPARFTVRMTISG